MQLSKAWGITEFCVISLKVGVAQVILPLFEYQSLVVGKEAINLKSGVMRILRWQPGFNPSNFKIMTTQIWIRLYELPLEYHKEQNVLNIAGRVGLPLKIDPLSLSLYHEMYTRVLIDVDLTQPLPEKILVKMIDKENNLDISFFVPVFYETIPKFCINCATFSHSTVDCNVNAKFIAPQSVNKGATKTNMYVNQRYGNRNIEVDIEAIKRKAGDHQSEQSVKPMERIPNASLAMLGPCGLPYTAHDSCRVGQESGNKSDTTVKGDKNGERTLGSEQSNEPVPNEDIRNNSAEKDVNEFAIHQHHAHKHQTQHSTTEDNANSRERSRHT